MYLHELLMWLIHIKGSIGKFNDPRESHHNVKVFDIHLRTSLFVAWVLGAWNPPLNRKVEHVNIYSIIPRCDACNSPLQKSKG